MLEVTDLQSPQLGPLSFTLAAEEIACIAGPSGSGKSLLLRALADLDSHEGLVVLSGERQDEMLPPRWRQRVGLLPAEVAWWGERVGDLFPRRERPSGMEELGFAPDVLDWEIDRLSTGESQRLGLLRLLAREPRILLLDEPSANLDEESTLRVEALVERYVAERGAAALWVSHSSGQQRRLGARVLVLERGRWVT